VGSILLLAAGLKAYGLALDPLSDDSFLATPRLQVAAIEIEVILGLWLLSGWTASRAWLLAVTFFGILASLSLYLVVTGQRSCACLGRVPTSPWLSLGIDLGVLAALLIFRPSSLDDLFSRRGAAGALRAIAGVGAVLAVVGLTVFLALKAPSNALARLRGESVTAGPAAVDVGDGASGEKRSFVVTLTNHTNHPVRIIGGSATCRCVATDDLPIALGPDESQAVHVEMTFRGGEGRFQQRFTFETDDEDQRQITARFAGRVTASPAP
jgi:hypothetical protein